MPRKIRIATSCAAGVAESWMMKERLENALRERGVEDVEVVPYKVADLKFAPVDIIVCPPTVELENVDKPIINGMPLIVGLNIEETVEQVIKAIEELRKKYEERNK